MPDLTFFNAEDLKKSKVDKVIDRILAMPKGKACKIKMEKKKLATLRNKLYMNHPGKFSISDKGLYLLIKWKNYEQ